MVVSETGNVTAYVYHIRGFPGRKLRKYGLFDERKRNKYVVLLQRKLPSDAHSEYVAVLSVHIDDGVYKILRYALAVASVYVERRVACAVFVWLS